MSINALLAAVAQEGDTGGLMLATVTGSSPAYNATYTTVLIDGADTSVSALLIPSDLPAQNDRVIVGRIGKSLYVLSNLTNTGIGGHISVAGAFSASGQPNGTSGTTFTVNRSGRFGLESSGSGFNTSGNQTNTYTDWIDGTSQGAIAMFVNVANAHTTRPTHYWEQNLSAGTHYFWPQLTGTGAASDSNDTWLLSWKRLS